MLKSNANYAAAGALVDALAGVGLRHACISPGSRSAPLALALSAHPEITLWVHHDERSSGFFALGIARTTRAPVAVVTTSGTAAAELLPAAVEARYGRVPLLLLTADRPPELRDVGAPQAIDQLKLYGDMVKWSHQLGSLEATPGLVRSLGGLASRVWAAAVDDPAGPVHINIPFGEPLAPIEVPGDVPEDLPAPRVPRYHPGRLMPDDDTVAAIAESVWGKKVLVVCGPLDQPDFADAAAELARAGRYPMLADPLSGVRAGRHDLTHVVAHGDALARVGFLDEEPPDAVLRFGASPTSKAISAWLAQHPEVRQIVVESAGWRDPGASAGTVLRADPASAARALAKATGRPAPEYWTDRWRMANHQAGAALGGSIRWARFPSEPGAVLSLAHALPAGAILWLSSSMPVRDVDTFFPATSRNIRFFANRGANGIDGFISSGLGSAALSDTPTYLLAGDLSALHDLSGLATAARLNLDVTIVVLNNDGGGIFHFLPYTDRPEEFERLFATPHGLSLAEIATSLGLSVVQPDSFEQLNRLLAAPTSGPRLIEVFTDRERNVRIHDAAVESVRKVLRLA